MRVLPAAAARMGAARWQNQGTGHHRLLGH